ncbi:MAG: antitoxin VapB family protein [Nanoarchaeota archaeon]|nr:antitoxin VapB family protein [Nanoarchaeota archaeon]
MVKVISLSNEAYEKLKALKREGSFSELVMELTNGKKKDIMELAGAFKDSADEWEEIKKKIYMDRKKFKLREVKF